MANRRRKSGSSDRFYFQKSLQTVTAAIKLKDTPWKENYVTNLDSILKSRDITLLTKVHIFKAMVFPAIMFRSESWTIKKAELRRIWCFRTVELEKTLESPLDCAGSKPVNPKEKQPWILIGRTDAEAEALILWPPDVNSWLTGRLWWGERLRAKREGGGRGWDGWMASLTQRTWIWANSGR